MDKGDISDLQLSHLILNYLHASLQGKFASLTIISKLKPDGAYEETIVSTRLSVEKVCRWLGELNNGSPILSSSWTEVQSFEAQHAFELLKRIKIELSELAALVENIVDPGNSDQKISAEDAKLLLAILCRSAYSRENYIRGLIEYSNQHGETEATPYYKRLLPEVTKEIDHIHNLLDLFQKENSPTDQLFEEIRWGSILLPAVLRTQVHDAIQIISLYDGNFTFDLAEFSSAEADGWRGQGFTPTAAGYWRAYRIDPEDAVNWSSIDIKDPAQAADWLLWGFNPGTALPWLEVGSPPDIARRWADAGFEAAEAYKLAKSGVKDPERMKKAVA